MSAAWLVILNWNGRSDTLELLASLKEADLEDTTVLIVDNASDDGTLDAVHRQHAWVQTLRTERNLGFAGGNNRGIDFAIAHGADVIGILNNDTFVTRDFWLPLVEDARTGKIAVSPDIRYADASEISWFLGGVVSPREGWVRHLQEGEQPSRDRPSETEVLTGCCIVASTSTWQTVGYFDERLWLIFEDSDWSMRARSRGVRLIIDPRSRIYHKVSRSIAASGTRASLYYFCRNGTIFAARWLGSVATIRFVWRWIVRAAASDIRHRGIHGGRDAMLRLLGLGAAVVGRGGPAGRWVSRIARQQSFTFCSRR